MVAPSQQFSFLEEGKQGGDIIDDCIDYLPIRTFSNFVLPPDERSASKSVFYFLARKADIDM